MFWKRSALCDHSSTVVWESWRCSLVLKTFVKIKHRIIVFMLTPVSNIRLNFALFFLRQTISLNINQSRFWSRSSLPQRSFILRSITRFILTNLTLNLSWIIKILFPFINRIIRFCFQELIPNLHIFILNLQLFWSFNFFKHSMKSLRKIQVIDVWDWN